MKRERERERDKNPNKSNIQRVDSVLRARGSFRVAVYRGRPVKPPAALRSVLTQGQRLARSAG